MRIQLNFQYGMLVLFMITISSLSVLAQTQIIEGYSWREYVGCGNKLCHYEPTNSFESAYKEFAAYRTPNGNANDATSFMNFRVAFPLNYNPSRPEPYPVILMLHGAGESGRIWSGHFVYAPTNVLYDNNSRNLLHGGNVHQQAANRNPTHPQAFPGIIIFPQVSYSGSWASGWDPNPTLNQEYVYEFLDHMVSDYNADINRIYVHGLSNGARGTWDTATKRADLFAAVLPMSGLPYESDIAAARLVTTPIRLYQGGTDTNPSPGGAMSIINRLVNLGGNPEYILYSDLGHGVWERAYAQPDFWSWMLDKDKRMIYSYADKRHLKEGAVINLCSTASRKIGTSYGYTNYQWKKDGVDIPGATQRDLTIVGTGNYEGTYSVSFTRPNGTTGESFSIIVAGEGAPTTPVLTVQGSTIRPYTLEHGGAIGSIGQTETRLIAPEGYTQYEWHRQNTTEATFLSTTNNVRVTNNAGTGGNGSNFNNQGNLANSGAWRVRVLEPSGCWSSLSNSITLVYNTNAGNDTSGDAAGCNPCHTSPSGTIIISGNDYRFANVGKPVVTPLSSNKMRITWADNVVDEAYFEIWRYRRSVAPYNTNGSGFWAMITTVPANTTEYVDTDVRPNAQYMYATRAIGNGDGRFSQSSNFTTTSLDTAPPTPPSELTFVSSTQNSITMSWSPSTDNDAVYAYEVYNGTNLVATLTESPVVGDPTDGNPHPPTTYTFTGLTAGETYLLNVRARDISQNKSTFPQALVASTQSLVNGVTYNYFFRNPMPGANGSRLESFDFTQTPDQSGTATNVNGVTTIANQYQNKSGQNAVNFFIEYTGYLQVVTAGNYRFYTRSDDGSRLYIDDVLVVNSDIDQGATVKSGVVNNLSVGYHKIKVQFYEVGGDNTLTVAYNYCTTPGCTPNDNFGNITNGSSENVGNGNISNNGNGTTSAMTIPNSLLWRTGTPALTNYYLRSTNSNDPTSLSSWTTSPSGGAGSSPANFTNGNQVFNIRENRTLSNPWIVSGNYSYVKVSNNATLTLNNSLTGRLSAEAGSTINLNTAVAPTFFELDPASTVIMNATGTVPLAVYGNLNLTGANTNTLPISSTLVKGNLQVNNQVTLNGSAAPDRSTLLVAGDVTFLGNSGVPPSANQYSFIFDGNTAHTLSVNQTDISLAALDVKGTLNLNFNDANVHTLNVGVANGPGGLIVRSGSVLNLGQHNLVVNGVSGINATGDTGELSVNGGNITLNATSQLTSSLYFSSANHTVNNLSLTNTGSGQINLAGPTKLTNLMTVGAGTVNMYGDFVLLSTSDAANGTARIAPLLNGARIAGNITVERYMSGEGRIWRYISSPVKNATVAQLQETFPITGNFTGASVINANSQPSMYQYTEPNYVQFPSVGGSNQEVLQTGRGYSPFIREETEATTWKLTGEPHQGDIPFTFLTPNAGNNPNLGWNLIGNPYPAPIQWTNGNSGGWTGSGLNGVARVRVNSYGNTQVLTAGVGDWSDGVIAPGQAFWVQTIAANPSLTVRESAKVVTDGAFYRKSEDENKVQITMRSGNLKDAAAIRFDASATASYDLALDAIKLDNSYFNLSSLTADNKPMALNNTTLNYCEQEVKFRITNAPVGSYNLDVTGVSSLISKDEVTFIDNFTQTELTVTDALTYAFTITADAASKADGRFALRFKKPEVVLNQTLKTEAACEQSSPIVLVNNSQPGVSYQAFHNGVPVSDAFMSTGGSLQVLVNPALVGIGATEVSIKAGFTGCNSYNLPMSISVQRDSLPLPQIIAEPTKLVATTENATYQWYYNGELVPEQTGKEWLNPENGQYVVEVFKGTCFKTSDTLEYVVTSVEKPNRLYQLYPNPTRDKFIVTLEEPIDFASVRVITSVGQVLQMPVSKISEYSAEVDLTEVKTGFYLLQVNGQRHKVLKE